MSQGKNNIVILGGGTSAYYISKHLRSNGVDLPITVLSEEIYLPYNRVLLPRLLREEIDIEKVFFEDAEWYSDNNIRFICGVEAVNEGGVLTVFPTNHATRIQGVDKDRYSTFFDKNRKFHLYEDLTELFHSEHTYAVIATGGDAFQPSSFPYSKNILTWRTIADTIYINNRIKNSKNIALVGGSFIGMELAMACDRYGIETDWSIITQGMIRDQIDNSIQSKIIKNFNSSVVTPYFVSSLDAIKDKGDRISAILNGKEKEYDVILLGTGIVPSLHHKKDFIKGQVSYYAGDMVSFDFEGKQVQTGSFNQAVKVAKYIAQDMAGEIDIADQAQQIKRDIALTPYQIKFGSNLIRLAGLVDDSFESKVEDDGKRITQTWYNTKGEKVGYCIV